MDYELRRTRRRTIALEITREGCVLVRAPLRMGAAEIDRFVAAHRDWIDVHLAQVQTRRAAHPPLTAEEIGALRARAVSELPGRVAHYAALMGVEPTGVKITSARTRFGSCSGRNSLCFSLYLMQYPPEAIDYVVVHELAHIRHHDHSAAFYREVARILPDYQTRQKLLRS